METTTDSILNAISSQGSTTTYEIQTIGNSNHGNWTSTISTNATRNNYSVLICMGVICALILVGNGCVVLLNMRKRVLNRSTRMHVGLLAACDMGFAVTMYAWQFVLYYDVEVRILFKNNIELQDKKLNCLYPG